MEDLQTQAEEFIDEIENLMKLEAVEHAKFLKKEKKEKEMRIERWRDLIDQLPHLELVSTNGYVYELRYQDDGPDVSATMCDQKSRIVGDIYGPLATKVMDMASGSIRINVREEMKRREMTCSFCIELRHPTSIHRLYALLKRAVTDMPSVVKELRRY